MSEHNRSLDLPLDAFQDALHQAVAIILKRYAKLAEAPAYAGQDVAGIQSWFDEALPEDGTDIDQVLAEVDEKIYQVATLNIAPKMFAYVMAGGNQVSIIGDLLSAAINQNVAKWHLAPSLSEVEQRVIHWAAEFLGLEHHAGGALVSGGSAANLTALTVARNVFFEQDNIRDEGLFQHRPFTLYGSTETHNSVTKSVEYLGIGRKHFRQIPTLEDFTIDVQALREQIQQDIDAGFQPFCIIGNAGTVNTGTIDPLDTLADIAAEYKLWFHVDGCYGALASGLGELRQYYQGLERADSIALDFHKWWYQTFEIGCVLVKDWHQMRRTFYTAAKYLDEGQAAAGRFNITEHHFDLSRNGKALKVWMSLKTYGAERMREMISKDIQLAQYLANEIQRASDFELVSSDRLAIVCFRYVPNQDEGHQSLSEPMLEQLQEKLIPALELDGRIFIMGTQLHGKKVIRACLINHRMQHADLDYLLDVIRDVGYKLYQQLRP